MIISIINKIAVIGAGIMGHGIAQLFAMYGYGPIKFADTRGIEAVIATLQSSQRKYRPHPRLLEMVKTGRLGKQSGNGFYDYES